MTDSMDTLLRGLPTGEPAYVRDHENGTWSVCIFAPGTMEKLETVATNMDKGVACWMVNKLKSAFARIHT